MCIPPCLDLYTFQRLQLHSGSAMSCPAGVVTIPQVVAWKIVRWICNSVWGRVWTPRAVCLWIHLSAPNQILLDRRLSPLCPPDILHSVWLQGVQDKVKGLRFSDQGPPLIHCPTHLHLTQYRTSPAPRHPPKVSPKPQAIHYSVLGLFFVFFFRQCNPESTLPCYSFVWTCEW